MRRTTILLVWSALAAFLLTATAAAIAQPTQAGPSREEAIALVRESIEGSFREKTGLSFTSFDCDLYEGSAERGYFTCSAVDEENDSFEYRLRIKEDGSASIDLVTQPATQLPDDSRTLLDGPCRAFLGYYDAREWEALHAAFHPRLQEALDLDATRAQLEHVRDGLGAVKNAELEAYGYRQIGRHELEYQLEGENGPGIFRCGVGFDEEEAPRLIAFLVTPLPGSPLQNTMLQPVARRNIGSLIDLTIESVDVPMDELIEPGDVVHGTATLEGGDMIQVRIEYTGDPDDFEPGDFSFQVLDVALVLERYFASKERELESIVCTPPVAPDGGTSTCEARLPGERPLLVTVERREGDHRIVSIEAADGGG